MSYYVTYNHVISLQYLNFKVGLKFEVSKWVLSKWHTLRFYSCYSTFVDFWQGLIIRDLNIWGLPAW
jgi:hypothetical protein